jgi:hypothetical protein
VVKSGTAPFVLVASTADCANVVGDETAAWDLVLAFVVTATLSSVIKIKLLSPHFKQALL